MHMHSYRGKDRLPVWILGLKESEEVLVAGVNSGWGSGTRSYSDSRSLRLRQFVGPSVVKSAEFVSAVFIVGSLSGKRCWGSLQRHLLGSVVGSSVMQGSAASAKAVEVLSDNCWDLLQNRLLRTMVAPTRRLTLIVLALLPCSYLSLDVSDARLRVG